MRDITTSYLIEGYGKLATAARNALFALDAVDGEPAANARSELRNALSFFVDTEEGAFERRPDHQETLRDSSTLRVWRNGTRTVEVIISPIGNLTYVCEQDGRRNKVHGETATARLSAWAWLNEAPKEIGNS